MVLEDKPIFHKCLIQTDRYNHTDATDDIYTKRNKNNNGSPRYHMHGRRMKVTLLIITSNEDNSPQSPQLSRYTYHY